MTARKALLHHGTSLHCLLGILSQGVMRTDLGSDDHPDGVSMSTDPAVAATFAAQAEEYACYAEGYPEAPGEPCAGAVLAFDKRAVARQARLRQVCWDGVSTEREVRAIDGFRIPDTLVSITVSDAALSWYRELADGFGFDEGARAVLDGLADHPLRVRPSGTEAAPPAPLVASAGPR